jgi:hypothetical protein
VDESSSRVSRDHLVFRRHRVGHPRGQLHRACRTIGDSSVSGQYPGPTGPSPHCDDQTSSRPSPRRRSTVSVVAECAASGCQQSSCSARSWGIVGGSSVGATGAGARGKPATTESRRRKCPLGEGIATIVCVVHSGTAPGITTAFSAAGEKTQRENTAQAARSRASMRNGVQRRGGCDRRYRDAAPGKCSPETGETPGQGPDL